MAAILEIGIFLLTSIEEINQYPGFPWKRERDGPSWKGTDGFLKGRKQITWNGFEIHTLTFSEVKDILVGDEEVSFLLFALFIEFEEGCGDFDGF